MRSVGLFIAALAISSSLLARPASRPPMHPRFGLLDAAGQSVVKSNQPISAMRTCGGCHDTQYIATHSYHTTAGLDQADPLTLNSRPGARNVGGADEKTGEMNCFLCHLDKPDNAARIAALSSGNAKWAITATLGSSAIVKKVGDEWEYAPSVVGTDGLVNEQFPLPRAPKSENCGLCHGQVHKDRSPLTAHVANGQHSITATTGAIFSPQRMKNSGMNLAGKDELSQPFDVHAERMLECSNCHHSPNNPAYSAGAGRAKPTHLRFEARKLDPAQYLLQPDHNFAKGHTPQGHAGRNFDGSMRRCESCHDAVSTHTWLLNVQRHLSAMNCEACHIPQVHAPAQEQVDWTMISPDGKPLVAYRGAGGPVDKASTLITGYRPVLLPRKEMDGTTKLTPHNLVSTWQWVAGTPVRPVTREELQRAFVVGDRMHPELAVALGVNNDAKSPGSDLRLDSPAKVDSARKRLEAIGLNSPRIVGQIHPVSLHHGVATGRFATRECSECHAGKSNVSQPIEVAAYLPGGLMPVLAADVNVSLAGDLQKDDHGRLVFHPSTAAANVYVLGHDRWRAGDWIGLLAVVGVSLGVIGHASLRYVTSQRRQ